MKKTFADMPEPEIAALIEDMQDAITLVAREDGVEKPRFFLLLFNDAVSAHFGTNVPRYLLTAGLESFLNGLKKGELPEYQ